MFDAPTTEWAARRNAPTIDVYLYDIREDVRRRHGGHHRGPRRAAGDVAPAASPAVLPAVVPDHGLDAAARGRAPPALDPAGALRAARRGARSTLLAARWPTAACPSGSTLALPPSEDRALSDIWSALGGELKPSLDLVVTAPLPFTPSTEVAPPVLESPTVVVRPGDHEAATARKGRGPARRASRPPSAPGPARAVRRGGRGRDACVDARGRPRRRRRLRCGRPAAVRLARPPARAARAACRRPGLEARPVGGRRARRRSTPTA